MEGWNRRVLAKLLISGATDGSGQYIDSDGNHVNVGNFNADGLNVNNNWNDNRYDNIGLSSARKSSLYLQGMPPLGGGIPFS